MSNQYFGFYFSGNADQSANDRTFYCEMNDVGNMKLAIRYKSAQPNCLYEMEFDADDLIILGQLLHQTGAVLKAKQT